MRPSSPFRTLQGLCPQPSLPSTKAQRSPGEELGSGMRSPSQYLCLKREGPEPQGPSCVPLLLPPVLQLQPERKDDREAPRHSQTPLCQAPRGWIRE